MERKVEVPAKGSWFLTFYVAPADTGNWELRATVNGKRVHQQVIDRKKGAWQQVSVELSEYADKTVTVRLENAANGWANEFGHWADIRFLSGK